jgi:CheY-like chemotaxis protein
MPGPNLRAQIILAEDNAADVLLVQEALAEHAVSCDLRVLGDGEQAMRFIDQLDLDSKLPCPDLLLLDLHLPKRDGAEILSYLRASERCAQTPVVVLTSSDSPGDHARAEKNAALHYFRKPATLRQFMTLGAVVRELIYGAATST